MSSERKKIAFFVRPSIQSLPSHRGCCQIVESPSPCGLVGNSATRFAAVVTIPPAWGDGWILLFFSLGILGWTSSFRGWIFWSQILMYLENVFICRFCFMWLFNGLVVDLNSPKFCEARSIPSGTAVRGCQMCGFIFCWSHWGKRSDDRPWSRQREAVWCNLKAVWAGANILLMEEILHQLIWQKSH